MTQRERVLATGLAVMMGLAGSLGVLYVFALEPIKKANDRLLVAQGKLNDKLDELNTEQAQIIGTKKVNPRLQQWADLSLSPRDPKYKPETVTDSIDKVHREQLQVDYEKYLHELLVKNRFKADSISIGIGSIEKVTPKQRGAKPTHERLRFNVTAKGDLENTQKMLKEFYETPLLHQVRSLTLDHLAARSTRGKDTKETAKDAPEGLLEVKMNVEALLIPTAKPRTTLMPSKLPQPHKVMPDDRDYSWLAKKNLFTGIKPPPPAKTKVSTKEDYPKQEKREDVLRFVKLTMVCYDPDRRRWEATMYDQARGGAERKLNTRVLSELAIYDRFDNTMLDAKVVYIDEKQLIFKEDGKFYRMNVGDFIAAVMASPLTASEVKTLGLSP